MEKDTKTTIEKTKLYFWNHHGHEMLSAMRAMNDKKLILRFSQELAQKAFDIYRKKVLYEEALDYASK